MPTQIFIVELLKTSPVHKKVLEQALLASHVPDNIKITQFQALIGNVTVQHHLIFASKDVPSDDPSHREPLHIEAIVQKHKIKRALIDGGSGLNICTYKLIK